MNITDIKECYYTHASLKTQSELFLKKVSSFRANHSVNIIPEELALLIIDCQKFFFEEASHAFVPSAPTILSKIIELQNYCITKNIPVFQTRHIDSKETKMMAKWWGDHLLFADNPLSEIVTELVKPEATIIDKAQYDAFYQTKLADELESIGIKQIIITGVMTHLCCETTTRSAFIRGYEPVFAIDGTATYNREFHLNSLINLAHGFAVPLLVEEILTIF